MSEITTIYRVQDAQGRGPYRPGFSHCWQDRSVHPVPERDQLIMTRLPDVVQVCRSMGKQRRCGFGFISVTQLQQWFSGTERQRLKELGFQFVRLDGVRVELQSSAEVLFSAERPLAEMATPIPLLN